MPPELYRGLLEVTGRYLSEASVRAAFGTALARRGLAEDAVAPADLPEIVAEAMVGLRAFCDPERVGDLMLDLAEYCERTTADGEGS